MPLIRSANLNLFIEIAMRIILFSTFCYMESMSPFSRYIQPFEMQTIYKYPRHDSFVPGGLLWAVVLAVPCVLSLLAWAVLNDCNDAFEFLLSWSLALGINGVVTDAVKLIAGRPRPDFFYRCFPDGIETDNMECNGDPAVIMDGRKSFPSGHSSLSFCSLGIGSVWLCGRLGVLSCRRGRSVFVVTCLLPLMMAAAIAVSRSCDHHHHWQVSFCSLGIGSVWLCGRLGVLSCRRGRSVFVVTCLLPLMMAAAIAVSRSCDHHHHWQDILAGSVLGFTSAVFCYRQYYNPLSSNLSGVPYIVSNTLKTINGKPDISPLKNDERESTPLLGSRKEDKWI